MRLIQAVTIGLIGLIILPGYLFFFDVTPKDIVLLLGTALLVACGGLRGASRVFSLLILFNLLSLAASTALSTDRGISSMGTNWREFGLIPQTAALLFAWSVASSPGNARAILWAVALSGGVAGAYGIAQYFGWDPLLPASAYRTGEGIWAIVRPPGTLGYVSYFATWLTVSAFLCMALETLETSAVWRWIARAAAAICVIAMALTGTRAALLGLAGGCAVWLYLRGFRMGRRIAAAAALAAILCVGFYFSPAGWNLRSRARWFAEDPAGGGRLVLWRDTLRMSAARPLAGFGPETYTAEFAKWESRELAAAYPDFEWESPHNIFLDALVSQGIFGLAAFAALCFAGLFRAFRTRGAESACIAGALAAGLLSQQFTAFTLPTAVLIYLTVGLLFRREAVRAALPGELSRANRVPYAMRAGFVAAALALVYFAVRLTAAGAALAHAQRALRAGDEAGAAMQYDHYRRWRFPGDSADVWYSRASLAFAQKTPRPMIRLQATIQAQAAASRAPATGRSPAQGWFNLSAFDALRGDSAAVERDLRESIAARPNWFKPHWALARLLALESRRPEAERESVLAVALDAGKDAEVTRTLADAKLPLH